MQIHIKNDHFYLREQINLSAVQITLSLDAKNEIGADTHSLETLLYFVQNSHQVVYMEAFSHHHRHPQPQNHSNHFCFCFQLREVTPIPTSIGAVVFAEPLMPLPPLLEDPHSLYNFLSGFQDDAEFGTAFDFLDVDFGADFTFKNAFDFASIGSGSFEYNNVSCEFFDECMLWLQQCIRCKKRLANCTYHFENIKKLCWYRYFTCCGRMQELMNELSSSDCFGDFCHWFCMLLAVEVLTIFLIDCRYIIPPRSHRQRAVFCKRLELLVISALDLAASGAAF